MATDYYKPTDAEWDEIDEWLETAHAEQGHLSADDVRFIAETFLPGRRLQLRAPALGVTDWVEVYPKPKPPAGPQPAAVQATSQPATAQPPQKHPNAAIQAARDAFVDTYGGTEGVKIITAHDGYDHSGRVVDAHLNSMSRGDGLDEQARAEIAALPGYGEPGWGEAKRKLTHIRAAAARRQAPATQQAMPGQSQREAERAAVAGFEGREDGTWAEVRRNAGNAFLSEWNREQARKWTPKL